LEEEMPELNVERLLKTRQGKVGRGLKKKENRGEGQPRILGELKAI
jgi:hypothetical protein